MQETQRDVDVLRVLRVDAVLELALQIDQGVDQLGRDSHADERIRRLTTRHCLPPCSLSVPTADCRPWALSWPRLQHARRAQRELRPWPAGAGHPCDRGGRMPLQETSPAVPAHLGKSRLVMSPARWRKSRCGSAHGLATPLWADVACRRKARAAMTRLEGARCGVSGRGGAVLRRSRSESGGTPRVHPARPEDLAALAALADAGRLRVHLDRVLRLAEAVDALRLSQTGRVRGKTCWTSADTAAPPPTPARSRPALGASG
ncbi:zinc-binding dehydrogenase [Streptomyces violaceus]